MSALLAGFALSGATPFPAPRSRFPGSSPFPSPQARKAHTFEVRGDDFVLDGRPFVIRSGEMHYPRVPRALWRDRFRKARAMGLNTVCTYVFWNLHEPTPGRFDFAGNLDLAAFVREAGEEGLKVIVRPGPYICTELDFGGLPAWLLKDRTLTVRSKDPKFLAATERYLREVGRQIRPLLPKNGGPILMAQVENEYGSYGSDHEYMAAIRDAMVRCGFDLQLFTSDGPGQGMLSGGTLPGIPETVNFGGGAEGAFAELAKFRAARGRTGGPRMIGEYWAGWFDHWGKPHHTTNVAAHAKDLEWCLKNGVSFNLYMFHGGTNWAFLQGANGSASGYDVDTTSYDYDAPLDESGRPTPKYEAFRALMARYAEAPLPPVPPSPPTIAIPRVRLEESAPLLADLPRPVLSDRPMTFEALDQSYGLVLYRTRVTSAFTSSGPTTLSVPGLGDYATVFVDGRRVGTLDRRSGRRSIEVAIPTGSVPGSISGKGTTIDLLVEGLSRVNFGPLLPTERKGIDGDVELNGLPLRGWEQYRFPLSDPKGARFGTRDGAGPRTYRGTLEVPRPGDTFLDLKGWNKGFVWVNGRNLGRFWSVGPQRTLFLPGVWLRRGRNEIVVFDDGERVAEPTVAGLAAPILDEILVDRSRVARREGQTVDLGGETPLVALALSGGPAAQTVHLTAPARARYVALEVRSEEGGGPYASLAEFHAVGPDGRDLDRKRWRVAYADSEEQDAENGEAANVLDNQPTTIWHTAYGAGAAPMPHLIVIDFGEEVAFGALRLLPRGVGVNGRIRDLRVFASTKPFKGL